MVSGAYKVMKTLLTLTNKDSDSIWIDYDNKKFKLVQDANLPEVSCPFPKTKQDIAMLLSYLSSNGYVKFDTDKKYINLTFDAFCYDEIVRQERIQYFAKSILVPIILSFITTMATNRALPWLSEQILQYIKNM